MTKKTAPVVVSEDEAADRAAEAQRASDERNAQLQAENAEKALLASKLRAEAAGVELNDHGVPMGIELTFEETMRMQRSMTALGTSAEHSEVEDAPAPKRRRK